MSRPEKSVEEIVGELADVMAMSLLDKFALAAMQGILARVGLNATAEDVARWSYDFAAAALRERGFREVRS